MKYVYFSINKTITVYAIYLRLTASYNMFLYSSLLVLAALNLGETKTWWEITSHEISMYIGDVEKISGKSCKIDFKHFSLEGTGLDVYIFSVKGIWCNC
jgi:hypothetical protein